jgi:hypothetical protein
VFVEHYLGDVSEASLTHVTIECINKTSCTDNHSTAIHTVARTGCSPVQVQSSWHYLDRLQKYLKDEQWNEQYNYQGWAKLLAS